MLNILITGGTGSLGQALLRKFSQYDHIKITVVSRSSHRQAEVAKKFHLPPESFILGDITDYNTMLQACEGQDFLIHAAALKVVADGQRYPEEFHRVNTLGTQAVCRAWSDTHRNSDKFSHGLYINSDKAVEPVNYYGATKYLGEAIALSHGLSSVRYGNVVESEGSFIHLWKEALTKGHRITLREPSPTRFYVPFDWATAIIDEIIGLIRCNNQSSEIFVPSDLSAFSLSRLAAAMGFGDQIDYEPLHPGEKEHEVLLASNEVALDCEGSSVVKKVVPGSDVGIQGWAEFDYSPYCSDSARRIPLGEMLKRLGISRRQEVFS